MKLLTTLAALFLSTVAAPAAILIFDGPAPLKTYGTELSARKNRAMIVYDTTGGQIGIINYFGRGSRGQQVDFGDVPVDGGTISLNRGSMTVLTGVTRYAPGTGDFDTRIVSFRGRNSLLNRTTDLTGPRVLTGIARATNRSGTALVHLEQSFSLAYQSKLSNAANTANDSFGAALDRVRTELENRGFRSSRQND